MISSSSTSIFSWITWKNNNHEMYLRSSPTGPAEHCAGGSLPKSCNSYKQTKQRKKKKIHCNYCCCNGNNNNSKCLFEFVCVMIVHSTQIYTVIDTYTIIQRIERRNIDFSIKSQRNFSSGSWIWDFLGQFPHFFILNFFFLKLLTSQKPNFRSRT